MEYQDLKSGIRNHLNDAAEDFFIVGYFLRQISECLFLHGLLIAGSQAGQPFKYPPLFEVGQRKVRPFVRGRRYCVSRL